MAAPRIPLITVEDYLEFDRNSEGKHEYYRGEILAMAGGRPNHSQITAAVTALLWVGLRQKPCRVFSNDARLAADPESHYTYPDVMVVCGERAFSDPRRDTLTNPILIVEVLSPTTERADRGRKFADYRKLESLREYLLISQFEPHAEIYRRRSDGTGVSRNMMVSPPPFRSKASKLPSRSGKCTKKSSLNRKPGKEFSTLSGAVKQENSCLEAPTHVDSGIPVV